MDREKLCEDVARALFEYNRNLNWDTTTDQNRRIGRIQAVAAIAAAEPHIRADERRKVLEGLITEAEEGDMFPFGTGTPVAMNDDLANWLRSYLEPTP